MRRVCEAAGALVAVGQPDLNVYPNSGVIIRGQQGDSGLDMPGMARRDTGLFIALLR